MKNRPYHSEDITFCIAPCTHTSCYRHKSQMRDCGRNHSVAEYKNTRYCPFPEERQPVERRKKNL